MAEKAPEAFRTISEVANDLDLPQHVLRFWETRFQQIKPLKRGGGRRYYRPDDIDLLRGIRHLLYSEGYTIRGAQRILKDHGIKFVQTVWRRGRAAAGAGVRGGGAGDPRGAATAPAAARCAPGRRGLRTPSVVRPVAVVPQQRSRRGASGGEPPRRRGHNDSSVTLGAADERAGGLAGGELAQAAGHLARAAGVPPAA